MDVGYKEGARRSGPPQKKKVPSDLISSLALYRHARHGALAGKSAGRFAAPLPESCVSQPSDQCFLARRLPPSARNRSLVTAFRSPATGAASQQPPSQGQSSQPATSLRCQVGLVPGPPFDSTTADPVCAGCGRFTAWGPLHFHYPVWPAAPAASAPLRDCYVPRDRSVQLRLLPPVHLTNSPDSLSLPAARSNESQDCGSSFQGRYVSAGLLFLKPLGTSFTMLPLRRTVNPFL